MESEEIVNITPCSEEYMTAFTNEFATAYLQGNLQKALQFFSPQYVAEQHDNALGGRTEQFIAEFLSGAYTNDAGEEVYLSPKAEEISTITVVQVECAGSPIVTVSVGLKNGKFYNVPLSTESVASEDGISFMFVGSLG